MKDKNSSWEHVGKWYNTLVTKKGHYYHKTIILPALLNWLSLKKGDAILDLACGQGVLARYLPEKVTYYGLDAAQPLIKEAKKYSKNPLHHFLLQDIEKPFHIEHKQFDSAAMILAFQNIKKPQKALKNASIYLKKGGKLVLALNHPCFRIPRQSCWGVDEKKGVQYRRIDRYMSPMDIPIEMHPSQKNGATTVSFHLSLTAISKCIFQAGYVITRLEEWCSNKKSEGRKAKMENRARDEFPLFLGIECEKI